LAVDGERELLKGNTPTLILAILRDGPMHGYAMAREIERRSDNALRFKEGTLYPALRALESGRLVCSTWEVQESGPARRVYKLTQAGHRELAKRTRIWSEFAEAIAKVIQGGPREQPA
jgi:PadR family transcriptional regulator PadR